MIPVTCTSAFAPSTTGEAHPGTLLAALLAWLDIRARGGRFVVRLENLDHLRCRPAWSAQMLDDLRWFGLVSVARRSRCSRSVRESPC